MMMLANRRSENQREVLVSCRRRAREPAGWLSAVADGLRPAGVVLTHADCGQATVDRVALGGLVGVVLAGGSPEIAPLSLLRVVRSIDADLPCWLVTGDMRRHTLQTALALRATGVFAKPVDVSGLTLVMLKILSDPRLGG